MKPPLPLAAGYSQGAIKKTEGEPLLWGEKMCAVIMAQLQNLLLHLP